MPRRVFSWFFVFGLVLMWGNGGFAEEQDVMGLVEKLQQRVEMLEKKLEAQNIEMNSQKVIVRSQQTKINDYEAQLLQFQEQRHRESIQSIDLMQGLELGVSGTMIVQGADNINYADESRISKRSRADTSYSVDVTLKKEFENIDGRGFLHLEAGQGSGLEDHLILYSNVNRDSGDSEASIELTEFWYEQALVSDKFVLTFGKLDPTVYFDQNDVANDETTQFLGWIFRNSPVIDFPDNGAGVRTAYAPVEWLELGYGLFDGIGGWEKVGDHVFHIGQVSFKTNLFDLPGNYRFYGWNNNADHTKWLDSDKTKESAFGFGLSFDQKFHDVVTVFTRYSWQNPKVFNPEVTAADGSNYSLEQSWSAGLQVEGKPWGRESDVLGLAVGQVMPSDDYEKADPNLRAKTEGHLEVYYKVQLNDHLSVSPDVQYIWNPYGKDIAENSKGIFVMGMRAQVDF